VAPLTAIEYAAWLFSITSVWSGGVAQGRRPRRVNPLK
jgi:hypothetical protein